MPNYKPRNKRQPSCLWVANIRDCRGIDKLIDRRDPRFTVTVIEYNRGAKLGNLVRDFRTLITGQREALRELDDLADELTRVRPVAEKLRRPKLAAARAGSMRLGLSPDEILRHVEETPWPSVREIRAALGDPFTLHRVKKLLGRVKADRKKAVREITAPQSTTRPRLVRTL